MPERSKILQIIPPGEWRAVYRDNDEMFTRRLMCLALVEREDHHGVYEEVVGYEAGIDDASHLSDQNINVVGYRWGAFVGEREIDVGDDGLECMKPESRLRALARRNKLALLDRDIPGWQGMVHDNGEHKFDDDGTLLDDQGKRSIFDDVDE